MGIVGLVRRTETNGSFHRRAAEQPDLSNGVGTFLTGTAQKIAADLDEAWIGSDVHGFGDLGQEPKGLAGHILWLQHDARNCV
jgi:hypothetical protein